MMKTLIQTPTNDLENSIDFYRKLNFDIHSINGKTITSAGGAVLEINADRTARAGIKMFQSDWSSNLEVLKSIAPIAQIEGGHVVRSPSGCWVYLMESDFPIADVDALQKDPSVLGNYMGVSLESISMEDSLHFWSLFGYKLTMGAVDKGFMVLMNDHGFGVSIMKPNSCPHLFFTPSLTYFNGGKNLPVIAKLRELQIPITEEITVFNEEGIVDNVIIRDPGGLGFFVFND